MSHVIDRQTVIISVNFVTFVPGPPEVPSIVSLPINLRFAADELILKTITYSANNVAVDVNDNVQIWCNRTDDNLIGSFPNAGVNNFPVFLTPNQHFRLSNTFQTGNFDLQFLSTDSGGPASYNPQHLISSQNPQRTKGFLSLTIEFVKYSK